MTAYQPVVRVCSTRWRRDLGIFNCFNIPVLLWLCASLWNNKSALILLWHFMPCPTYLYNESLWKCELYKKCIIKLYEHYIASSCMKTNTSDQSWCTNWTRVKILVHLFTMKLLNSHTNVSLHLNTAHHEAFKIK
jgi:hypothetical protein